MKLFGWLRRLLLLLRQALLATLAAVQLKKAQQARGAIVASVNWPRGKPRRVLGLVHVASWRGRCGRKVVVGAVLRRVRLIYVLLLLLLVMIVGSLLIGAVVRVELRAQVVDGGLLLLLLLLVVLVLRCSGRVVVLMAAGLLGMVRVLSLELGEE